MMAWKAKLPGPRETTKFPRGGIDAARTFLATETTIGKRAYDWSGIEVKLWLAANYVGGFDQLMRDLKGRS